MNAVEIEQALSDLAAQAFDGAKFPFQFLAAFGNKTTTIARLRKGESNASDVPGGVLQRNHIHIAVAEPGQVGQTLTALKASPKTIQAKAKFLLATDGTTLWTAQIFVDLTSRFARSAVQTLPVTGRRRNYAGESGCRTSRCNRTRPRLPPFVWGRCAA